MGINLDARWEPSPYGINFLERNPSACSSAPLRVVNGVHSAVLLPAGRVTFSFVPIRAK